MSCIVRAGTVVLVIVEVPVEMPPAPLVVRLLLGNPKLAWLNAFAASARICRLTLSQMLKVLPSERFTVLNAGPFN